MISIKNLNKYYYKGKTNENHVINNISLELPDTGLVAIFGKSGCGKTTLLNLIGGLDKANNGDVLINNEKQLVNNDKLRNESIGYIFQNYNLNINITVLDNVKNALRLCGMTDEEELERRSVEALTAVGMEKFRLRYPMALSGGQQQRVAIARAIVKNPTVILADEPTGNLDEQNTILVMDLLKKVSKTKLVLLVTHEVNLVDYYCDQVIELVDGKVTNIRTNDNASGLSSKSKNDIYLGELDHSHQEISNINIDYYGAKPNNGINIKLVNYKDKLYLDLSSSDVTVLSPSSEIKLKEGIFEEKKEEAEVKFEEKPFEYGKLGRLFNLKESIKTGYSSNFKGKKKGAKLLLAAMVLFSILFVVITAVTGVSFSKLINIEESHNKNSFYVYTDSAQTYNVVKTLANDANNGITDYLITNHVNDQFNFSLPTFETTQTGILGSSISVYSDLLPISKIKGKMIYGDTNLSDDEIVVSSEVANRIINTAKLSYIKTYKDVIGLSYQSSIYGRWGYMSGSSKRVVGIVESSEAYIYISDFEYAKDILASYPVYPISDLKKTIDEGYAVYYNDELTSYAKKTVSINDVSVDVDKLIKMYSSYEEFAKTINGHFSSTYTENSYFSHLALEKGITQNEAREQYYQDYLLDYYQYLEDYIDNNYLPTYSQMAFAIYKEKGIEVAKDYIVYSTSDYPRCVYYNNLLKLLENDDTKTYSFTEISDISATYTYELTNEYNELYNRYYMEYANNYFPYGLYVSEKDYIKMAYQLGYTTPEFRSGIDFSQSFTGMYQYGAYYTLVISNNIKKTTDALNSVLGELEFEYGDMLVINTPSTIRGAILSNFGDEISAKLISYVVIIAVLSICMYFIMRSSMIKRIKEIGIYRAIGASKKNITFKFFIEAIVLSVLTIIIGNIITSTILMYMYYKFSLVSEIFYYPFWLFAIGLVVELSISVFFGTLPVISLLRKTPSEILTKYDI